MRALAGTADGSLGSRRCSPETKRGTYVSSNQLQQKKWKTTNNYNNNSSNDNNANTTANTSNSIYNLEPWKVNVLFVRLNSD